MIATKREEALERNAKWASLSIREQLATLDRRFGENQGAKKQRTRLTAKLKEQAGRTDGRETSSVAKTDDQFKTHLETQRKLKAKDRREQERAAARAGK
jgi:hypothetical protein